MKFKNKEGSGAMDEQEVIMVSGEDGSEYLLIEDNCGNQYKYKIKEKLLLKERKKFTIGYRGVETAEVAFISYKLRTTLDDIKRTFNIKYYPKDHKYTLISG